MTASQRRALTAPVWAAAAVLTAALLPAATPALASTGSVILAPEDASTTAVRSGQAIVVSGELPGPLDGARLVGIERDGDEVAQPLGSETLGRPAGSAQYLRADGGTLSGRIVLGCLFDAPSSACPVPHEDVVAVRLDVDSGPSTVRSGTVRVDYVRPQVHSYRTVSPQQVEVRFTEPVTGDDSALDWTVQDPDVLVTGVSRASGDCGYLPASDGRAGRSGCTRLLDVTPALGEDQTPFVEYVPALNRPLYEDDAGNALNRASSTPAASRAVDAIRPAAPSIEQVEGQSPTAPAGSDGTPELRVGNVVPGHRIHVELVPPAGASTSGPPVTATASTVQVTAPALPADGRHRLRVVAVDPAGNASDDATLRAARADGAPSVTTYRLDTTAPRLVSGVVAAGRVDVALSEAVSGPDAGADWVVTDPSGRAYPVTAVTGSGSSRVLSVSDAPPAGSTVAYRAGGARYVDAVGNPLADQSVRVGSLAAPVVLEPAAALVTAATRVTITGATVPDSTVLLHVDADRDGALDGGPAQTVQPSGTSFGIDVDLPPGRRQDLLLVARHSDGRESAPVAVPPITHDDAPPVLQVPGLPGEGQVVRGGSTYEARYATCDANLGAAPLLVELSTDAGASWSPLGGRRPAVDDCTRESALPLALPEVTAKSARLRVVVTDLAGRTASVTSAAFALRRPGIRDVRDFACPPDRVQPAGFRDTSGSTFGFEIDCLVAYGFTRGTTPTRYEPARPVSRAQMAVFVARVAQRAGVELDGSDAGFRDVAGARAEVRDAVNGLANAGVVNGLRPGVYDPAGDVTRAQMASFLVRLQDVVGVPFPTAPDAFDDDTGVHEDNIDRLAAAGVVQGPTPRRYVPLQSVTREQMAAFLLRYVDGRIEAEEMSSPF